MTLYDDGLETFSGTLVTDLYSGRPVLRRVLLEIVNGEAEGAKFEVSDATMIIGSHKSADIPIKDARASRSHAEVVLVGDAVRLRDLGSKNGTFVGRARVDSQLVNPGETFRVGTTRIRVRSEDAPVAVGGQDKLGNISAKSESMRTLFALLRRVANTDVTVLLEGETGVGKEVTARAVHDESPRHDGPFVVFDCGSVSEQLIASELFGHKKGAFTGAIADRVGVFEAARGGTVFLDEIGELKPDLQPSLLRVLEQRQVRRVGETKPRDVDVRIVAATNRDLSEEVERGRFREDLFFRLAVVRAKIPALRDRRPDIPFLANLLLKQLGHNGELPAAEIKKLLNFDWPGNVRQLKNCLEQSFALSEGELSLMLPEPSRKVTPQPLTSEMSFSLPRSTESSFDDLLTLPFREARDEAMLRFERVYLKSALERAQGNVSQVAKDVGIARNYVHRLMKRCGLARKTAFEMRDIDSTGGRP